MPSVSGMVAEVAASTGRSPRVVYREESLRTVFLTWTLQENGRMRPFSTLLSAFSGTEDSEPGVLPGGRGEEVSKVVRDAARKGAKRRKIPHGGVMNGNTLVIDIDDPGVSAAYAGRHPKQKMYRSSKGFKGPVRTR